MINHIPPGHSVLHILWNNVSPFNELRNAATDVVTVTRHGLHKGVSTITSALDLREAIGRVVGPGSSHRAPAKERNLDLSDEQQRLELPAKWASLDERIQKLEDNAMKCKHDSVPLDKSKADKRKERDQAAPSAKTTKFDLPDLHDEELKERMQASAQDSYAFDRKFEVAQERLKQLKQHIQAALSRLLADAQTKATSGPRQTQ